MRPVSRRTSRAAKSETRPRAKIREYLLAGLLVGCGSQDVKPDAGEPMDAPFVPPRRDATADAPSYMPKGKVCTRDEDAAAPAPWQLMLDGGTDAMTMDEGGEGGMDPGDPLALPIVYSAKGIVAQKPVFVPITFDGDELRNQIEDFTASVGCSSWWHATATDYGIADAIGGTPIHLSEQAPMEISDPKIQQWLIGKLNTDPSFPKPNGANLLYAIFYPDGTVIDAFNGKSCFSFGAYHGEFNYKGMLVPYAVMPRCGGLDQLTAVTSHEFIEYATDPIVGGYYGTSNEFAVWGLGYQEVGDMCSYATSANYLPNDYPFYVQRSWSNKAAFFGENPCVPGDSPVWYAGVPIMTDWVSIAGGKIARGVKIPTGQMRTIDVKMIAKGMTGAWSVDAWDLSGKNILKFAWDKSMGNAGDTLHLTITRLGTSAQWQGAPFWITSSQSNDQHIWFGIVGD